MATIARHQDISGTLLEHAEVEFEKGDMLQASEKAWGAPVHYLKSVAMKYGWRHHSHASIGKIADRLIPLTDDPDLSDSRFGLLETLHRNFYEENQPKRKVAAGIRVARLLINDMKAAEARLPRRRGPRLLR